MLFQNIAKIAIFPSLLLVLPFTEAPLVFAGKLFHTFVRGMTSRHWTKPISAWERNLTGNDRRTFATSAIFLPRYFRWLQVTDNLGAAYQVRKITGMDYSLIWFRSRPDTVSNAYGRVPD